MSDTEAQKKTEDVVMEPTAEETAVATEEAAPAEEQPSTEEAPAVETPAAEDAPTEQATETFEEPAAKETSVTEDVTMEEANEAPVDEKTTTEEESKPEESKADQDETVEANGGSSPAPPVSKRGKTKNGSTVTPASKRKGAASKSAAVSEESGEFKIGDIVLTKLKGYPSWPSIIADPESAPQSVLNQKPSGSRMHLSRFFPVGDYSWSLTKELKHLRQHEITAYLQGPSKQRSGELFKGYQVAEDPAEWLSTKEQEAAEAAAISEGQDELAEDDDEADDSAGKKRKRGGASEKKTDAKAKKAKVEKTPKSKRATKAAANEDEEDEVMEEAASPVSKRRVAKPKAKKDTQEEKAAEAAEDAEDDPLASDPDAKKVKDWRHKLQRAFLNKSTPAAEEMDSYNELFNQIESYEGMTVEYLAYSKIGKVMKKIAGLKEIPRDGDLKITERALKLMSKWQEQVGQDQSAA